MSETAVRMAAEELLERAQLYARDFEAFLAGHPELTTVPPASVAGWAALIAAGAYFLGTVPTAPTDQRPALEQWAHTVDLLLKALQQPDLSREDGRRVMATLRAVVTGLERTFPKLAAGAEAALTASPATIQTASPARVADAVARIAAWQRVHHGRVHRSLAEASGQQAGAMAALGAASVQAARETTETLRTVIRHALPQLRRELVRLVQVEAQARRQADVEVRTDLRARIETLTERIGDIVRWLRTEALPELREDVRAERLARQAADVELRRRLREATETLEATDADLATQLAPLVAWAGAFGLHTTEKVARNEPLIDQLGRTDWSGLLALTAFPGLAALVARLLVDSGDSIPGVVGAMESAAAKALGAVY